MEACFTAQTGGHLKTTCTMLHALEPAPTGRPRDSFVLFLFPVIMKVVQMHIVLQLQSSGGALDHQIFQERLKFV